MLHYVCEAEFIVSLFLAISVFLIPLMLLCSSFHNRLSAQVKYG